MKANAILKEIVSRETFSRLEEYKSLVLKWNSRVNLLSKNTDEKALETHITDCIDLAKNIPLTEGLVFDIGSGSGLPGIVLALFGIKNITLVESDLKKAVFLEEVKRIMNLNVKIIRGRVENIKDVKASVVVSRAMTNCCKLMDLCLDLISEETEVLLMKSVNQLDEVEQLKKHWIFDLQTVKNKYIENHIIFHLKELSKK